MKVISLEEAQSRLLNKHGSDISMFNYEKMGSCADFKCNKCNHEWSVVASQVIDMGYGCKLCGYERTKKLNSLTKSEAMLRLRNTHGGRIECLSYTSMSEKAKFKCLTCGFEWQVAKAKTVIYQRGCKKCSIENRSEFLRTPLEDVIKYIESRGCRYIEGKYEKASKSKLLIEYSCGHKKRVTYDSFKKGNNICLSCYKRKIGDQLRKPLKKIIEDLKNESLQFIEFPNDYKNGKSEITYSCYYGHIVTCQINSFYNNRACAECSIEKQYLNRRGSGHPNWNGGTSSISALIKGNMIEWRKESIKQSNYRCFITGDSFDVVHHLYGFNMILDEAIGNLNIAKKNNSGEYNNQELQDIVCECKRLHRVYPLGICLRGDIHITFHKKFGFKNNTPEQFYEFAEKIKSGEIKI